MSSLSEDTVFFTVSGRPKNIPLPSAGFFDETSVYFFSLQQEKLFYSKVYELLSLLIKVLLAVIAAGEETEPAAGILNPKQSQRSC